MKYYNGKRSSFRRFLASERLRLFGTSPSYPIKGIENLRIYTQLHMHEGNLYTSWWTPYQTHVIGKLSKGAPFRKLLKNRIFLTYGTGA